MAKQKLNKHINPPATNTSKVQQNIQCGNQAEQDVLIDALPAEKQAEVERFIRFVLEGGA